jgi:hypothetical protein
LIEVTLSTSLSSSPITASRATQSASMSLPLNEATLAASCAAEPTVIVVRNASPISRVPITITSKIGSTSENSTSDAPRSPAPPCPISPVMGITVTAPAIELEHQNRKPLTVESLLVVFYHFLWHRLRPLRLRPALRIRSRRNIDG